MKRMMFVVAACLAVSSLAGDSPSKPVSRVNSCQKRFSALCAVMHRCSTGAEDLGGPSCEAIDPGCDGLPGEASYDLRAVDACVAGLEQLSCTTRVDPSDAAKFEERVAACQTLALADEELAKADRTRLTAR